MISAKSLINALQSGTYDNTLSHLYALDGTQASLKRARKRAVRVTEEFSSQFAPSADCALFSGPGRTEIGGNHTDHQHGRVLAGSVDLDIIAAVAPNNKNVIRIQSEGFPMDVVELDDLEIREEEKNTSQAIIRGIAAWFKGQG